ncbi:hypothetical protein DL98DRAFT_543041 [Cadophora sp. DSE1049]|nr:hypothetical protein DL98DRAFT_543041 [Cadophora sp. DSE1049]
MCADLHHLSASSIVPIGLRQLSPPRGAGWEPVVLPGGSAELRESHGGAGMERWGGGGFVHLDQHRDVRPPKTEDYRQNGYENHPTTSTRVESETPTSRERLEVSGIMAYFVESTPLVRVQNFHVELTITDLRLRICDLEAFATRPDNGNLTPGHCCDTHREASPSTKPTRIHTQEQQATRPREPVSETGESAIPPDIVPKTQRIAGPDRISPLWH